MLEFIYIIVWKKLPIRETACSNASKSPLKHFWKKCSCKEEVFLLSNFFSYHSLYKFSSLSYLIKVSQQRSHLHKLLVKNLKTIRIVRKNAMVADRYLYKFVEKIALLFMICSLFSSSWVLYFTLFEFKRSCTTCYKEGKDIMISFQNWSSSKLDKFWFAQNFWLCNDFYFDRTSTFWSLPKKVLTRYYN